MSERITTLLHRLHLHSNTKLAFHHARQLPTRWGKDQDEALVRLKDALSSLAILTFPSSDHPITLHTDASSVGAGAVSTKVLHGGEFIISFPSSCFSKSDANQGATDREYMAALCAVGYDRQYLAGRYLSGQ